MRLYENVFKKLRTIINSESTIIIGLGNPDRSDDAVGIRFGSRLKSHFPGRVFLETERSSESIVLDLIENETISHVLFVDATDFTGKPGEVRLFNHQDAKHFIPSISTHKVPITLLMDLLIHHHKEPYLLGIQPGNLALFGQMSDENQKTMKELEKALL